MAEETPAPPNGGRKQNSSGAWRAAPTISRSTWDKMLEAYRSTPTLAHVQRECKVGAKLARRAFYEGFPQMGLLPFTEIQKNDVAAAHRKLREQRLALEADLEGKKGDAATRSAEDAMIAKYARRLGLRAGEAAIAYADRILDLIEQGKIDVDKVTPRELASLGRLADSLTSALDRIGKIGKDVDTGGPGIAIQIALILDTCTSDELDQMRTTGKLPARVLGLPEPMQEALPPKFLDVKDAETADEEEAEPARR